MKRKKLYSFINIFGLSCGIALCALILLFIKDEFSFDSFHEHKDKIYRVHRTSYQHNQPVPDSKQLIFPLPFADAFKDEVPEIEKSTPYVYSPVYIQYQDQVFRQAVHFVSEDFMSMFTMDYLAGHQEHALSGLKDMIISHSVAEKFFGEEDPMGKNLLIKRDSVFEEYRVTAVFEDMPANSSLNHQILIRFENHPAYAKQKDDWQASYTPVFVQLHEQAEQESLLQKTDAFVEKHFGWETQAALKSKQISPGENYVGLGFTSLNDIHFDNTVHWHKVSNLQYSFILGGIAMLILVVAGVNYVLLSLTSAASRTKEVGIRKVLGAGKMTIQWQFWGEAQLLAFMAMVLGLTLAQIFLPSFNLFTGKNLGFAFAEHPEILIGILLLTVFVGLLAGGYPAAILSQYLPSKVLKDYSSQKYRSGFARYLIAFQLSVCLSFIASALVMYQQLKYISEKELGFNKEQVVVIPMLNSQGLEGKTILERFRHALADDQQVESITAMHSLFGSFAGTSERTYQGKQLMIHHVNVDHHFFTTMEMEIVEGEGFSQEMVNDTIEEVVINEKLAAQLAYDHLISNQLPGRPDSKIVGVVKDFNFHSLAQPIEPMSFHLSDRYNNLLVKIAPYQIPTALQKLENTWKAHVPGEPYSYSFLDEKLSTQYDTYQRWMNIMTAATLFGIALACLGLFGLTGITAVNRTKEIGIRKVLGACVYDIIILLNREILWLSLLAALMAFPVAYYAMSQWLQTFAFRIIIGWEIFVFAFTVGLLLVIFTISFHTLKTALTNPVESLRYE